MRVELGDADTGDAGRRIEAAQTAWRERLARDRRRVVILDDDPTGTQTSSDVGVSLRPSRADLGRFLDGTDRAVFILTNTRALPEPEAVEMVRWLTKAAHDEAGVRGLTVTVLLRGDSTLRGHVFAEIDAAAAPGARAVVVPAFPQAGRVTVGGRHLVRIGGTWLPASETEFAADPVFGYRSERLDDWVREVGGDRPTVRIDLAPLRRDGPRGLAAAIAAAPPGGVVLPDAVDEGDLATIAHGIVDAEATGIPVVVRSAASLASVRAGLRPRALERLSSQGSRVLVVCGSHTAAATEQLAHLERQVAATRVVVPTDAALGHQGGTAPAASFGRRIDAALDSGRIAILATERRRHRDHNLLTHGAAVMGLLVATVEAVRDRVDLVVAKGGITSAEVARSGLGAVRARVRGQLADGIPVWDVELPGGAWVPYVVVPGNVGGPDALTDVVSRIDSG